MSASLAQDAQPALSPPGRRPAHPEGPEARRLPPSVERGTAPLEPVEVPPVAGPDEDAEVHPAQDRERVEVPKRRGLCLLSDESCVDRIGAAREGRELEEAAYRLEEARDVAVCLLSVKETADGGEVWPLLLLGDVVWWYSGGCGYFGLLCGDRSV